MGTGTSAPRAPTRPGAPSGPAIDLGTAGLLSLAAHACAAFGVLGAIHIAQSRLFTDEPPPREEPTHEEEPLSADLMEIELPELKEESPLLADERAPRFAVEVPAGGAKVSRVDSDRAGRGGDDKTLESALNLADQDDGITRIPSTMTHLDVSQLPRIDTNKLRRSYEDYRASREPMELTFVAIGTDGVAEERRKEAKRDPGKGVRAAAARNRQGAKLGATPMDPGEEERDRLAGSNTEGGKARSPGAGARSLADAPHESSALRNAEARPQVTQGDPSVPSTDQGRPNDDVEDEQAVATRMLSFQHASTAGGAKRADGRGGETGSGPTGAGGTKGPGQSSSPAGAGGSGPADVERNGYVRSVQQKVHPLWANAFPKFAAMEGRGGSAVISFTIEADGSVKSARIARSSGIPEFDENVRQAVLRGAPFGKLPASLGPRFSLSITFNAPNPAVRPKHSNDGPQ